MLLNFSRENADGTSVKQLGSNYWDFMVPSLDLSKKRKKSWLLMFSKYQVKVVAPLMLSSY